MQSPPRRSIKLLWFTVLAGLYLAGCSSARASEDEIEQAWQTSAHADVEAAVFTRWNDEDPAQIPENCAKCHSTTGYRDFLGLDGATDGQVDQPAPVGTTVECEACHNEATAQKESAVMPSGVELVGLGKNANCMECHQGRQSAVSVSDAVAGLEPDAVNEELSFLNIHNNAAGPTLHGAEAMGGYEYEGQTYAGRYDHVAEFNTCIECHDAHTLRVDATRCNACHINAVDVARLKNIRVSKADYDGDGNTTEGLVGEIETMREQLLRAMRIYTIRTDGVGRIVYEDRNPYFFDQAGERYATWTPRLLKAAYNYQYVRKESSAYPHNGRYQLQLLYDSLDDLGADMRGLSRPVVK